MGLRNSPATHQRRVTLALKDHIGKICHVYLDDIIVWSKTLEEHERNVAKILASMRAANLYCSMRKSQLFCTEVNFLGHRISARGIEADDSKVDKVLNWPVPKTAKHVRQFLGIVRYISAFLPTLAEHTAVLTPLTRKECNTSFPSWEPHHQFAFEAIKALVLSRDCLTTIDHENPGDNLIFVTCDASKRRTGAVLSFGPTWETARPVAFESRQLRGPELNYPVHEQEMLAIIRALQKWRVDLLGSHVQIYTDHKTLQNFDFQKDLSKRQARWMEFMSQYEYEIKYIPGEDNTVADALSRLPISDEDCPPLVSIVAPIFSISSDESILRIIKAGYKVDPFCLSMLKDIKAGLIEPSSNIVLEDGLLYINNRLLIPKHSDLRENLFRLAHDCLGHFGGDKTYSSLRDEYYWPNMRRDLINAYVPSCAECQRNKSRTKRPTGPLHPLPVPDDRFDSVTLDFVGPLPPDEGYDALVTMTDRLGCDIQVAPCKMSMTAAEFASIFFDKWYCENGCPREIISDRDKLFISKFWSSLMKRAGIHHKLSTSYHPQTDGLSERSNKTVIQCLRFHVERNQKGWVRALPKIRFDIMNTINSSTGFSPFQLKTGHSPRIIPPIVTVANSREDQEAISVLERLQTDILEAKDNLTCAKISQAHQANKTRNPDLHFAVGDMVLLTTVHRRKEYMQAKDGRVAKFMPRFDGPYKIIRAYPDTSSYTLELPASSKLFPTFHSSQLQPFIENDSNLFPSRSLAKPPLILTPDGQTEYFIDKILDERPRGRGRQYLVRWSGYGPESDLWLPGSELADTTALDDWETQNTVNFSEHGRV